MRQGNFIFAAISTTAWFIIVHMFLLQLSVHGKILPSSKVATSVGHPLLNMPGGNVAQTNMNIKNFVEPIENRSQDAPQTQNVENRPNPDNFGKMVDKRHK